MKLYDVVAKLERYKFDRSLSIHNSPFDLCGSLKSQSSHSSLATVISNPANTKWTVVAATSYHF